MKKKNNTPKFFTEEWYPLNIIILVFCILLIAVLIWGGVTNWKFIPKKPQHLLQHHQHPPQYQHPPHQHLHHRAQHHQHLHHQHHPLHRHHREPQGVPALGKSMAHVQMENVAMMVLVIIIYAVNLRQILLQETIVFMV